MEVLRKAVERMRKVAEARWKAVEVLRNSGGTQVERSGNGMERKWKVVEGARNHSGTKVEDFGTRKNKNPPVTHAAGGFSIA